jgi:tRNA1(Val) A37 N6-methylase TrmN6
MDELSKHVKCLAQISYPQLDGRKQPDATLGEHGDYLLEAEWEGNEHKGLIQAAKYLRLGVKGVFVVCFPIKLKRPMSRETLLRLSKNAEFTGTVIFNDERTEDFFKGPMDGIIKWMVEHIRREVPVKEIKTSEVIRVIRDCVDYISDLLAGISKENIEEIFGGKSIFENVLQYEAEKYPLKEMRKGAAYLLVNQILFYYLLSKSRPDDFEELREDELKSLEDLQRYFNRVLDIDYRPVFGFKIAAKLPAEILEPIKETISIIKVLKPERIKQDVLGKIFHDLIPFEVRKAVAAFYTNNQAAYLLANLAINSPEDKVIDLACGSGTLLVSAYKRKKDLHLMKVGKFSEKEHLRFLEQDLTGIDIMAFAGHLTAIHLSLQAPLYETQKVRLAVWDSTEPTIRPKKVIPTISRELKKAYSSPKLDIFSDEMGTGFKIDENSYVSKGAITPEGFGGDALELDKVDVVMMNPPFTRQERLPEAYKNTLMNRFRQYSRWITGQLGLHGYFIFLADMFLDEGGRLAFVLPATVLRLKSMKGIREFLAENYRLDYVITTEQRSAFSESARFREILLVATKTKHRDDPCLFVNLKRIPIDDEDARFLAEEIRRSKEMKAVIDDADLTTKFVSCSELAGSTDNWFRLLVGISNEPIVEQLEGNKPLKPLIELLKSKKGKVIRGIEHWTGKPISIESAFILSSERHAMKQKDKWVLKESKDDCLIARDRYLGKEVKVPKGCFWYALRRPSGLESVDITEELDYVVVSRFNGDEHFFRRELLKKGGEISREVKSWRKYLKSRMTNLVISRRFNLSAPKTAAIAFCSDREFVPAKMFWSVKGLDTEAAKILALWFNSTFNIEQVLLKRAETEGAFMGLDEYVLEEFMVPDLDRLEKDELKSLLSVYDRVAKTRLPSILQQLKERSEVRRVIDEAFAKIFEMDIDLDKYYELVAKNIDALARIMKEGK